MQAARRRRDTTYDGVFLVGVRSTGIFCRPSCPARSPLEKNVLYLASVAAAEQAGLRACKRCRPTERAGAPPAWVRKLIARVEQAPEARIKDGDLRTMGIDPARARRWFGSNYGMTFHAWARQRRLGRAFTQLKQGSGLDEVAMDHGFESPSGFREAFARVFGAAPGQSREATVVTYAWIESPLGPLVAGATDDGLCLLEFSDRRRLERQLQEIQRRFKCAAVPGAHPILEKLEDELVAYFAGRRHDFTVPLVFPGTEFQRKVWQALLTIPYGETRSYDDVARLVGSPAACRAVGTANGMNRIAIVIPCHRVVNKSGALGGYGGGLWRKQRLLEIEQGRKASAAA
jgi:AraC family transcriptional regulator of adaptative response/methylated-DNA-[protein]-cysteine methyltransferase